MKYVLIFFMAYSKPGGPATAEFGDKAACEHARSILFDGGFDYPKPDLAVCVPYSTEVINHEPR
ncbi:hypothetical protein [Agrobacterium sp. 10MFCol1.1]|uniref:hypothetical protein n=1 Tax=Agrobacterium sp. 10MFCol1.1 TaxID=1150775 RepID=UPI000378DA18|nr:hypothetical protein [Agrobacterium sp. 10MFCol1.1]